MHGVEASHSELKKAFDLESAELARFRVEAGAEVCQLEESRICVARLRLHRVVKKDYVAKTVFRIFVAITVGVGSTTGSLLVASPALRLAEFLCRSRPQFRTVFPPVPVVYKPIVPQAYKPSDRNLISNARNSGA